MPCFWGLCFPRRYVPIFVLYYLLFSFLISFDACPMGLYLVFIYNRTGLLASIFSPLSVLGVCIEFSFWSTGCCYVVSISKWVLSFPFRQSKSMRFFNMLICKIQSTLCEDLNNNNEDVWEYRPNGAIWVSLSDCCCCGVVLLSRF